MDKKILNKDISIENNLVIITEQIETKLNRNQLELKLRDLQMQKSRLQEQNSRLVSDYNKLIDEENEVKDLISQLSTNEVIEQI